jgi:hypothetical protein
MNDFSDFVLERVVDRIKFFFPIFEKGGAFYVPIFQSTAIPVVF